MGKGKTEQYVVCQNPRCKPYDNPRHKAWRYVSRGREACQFCSTPFRVPVAASGSPAADGWKTYNAKGRAVPAPSPASWPAAAKSKEKSTEKPPDEDVLAQMYRARYKDDPEKLRQLDEIFPPPPRTEADIIRDALAAVEKAQAAELHICKVCGDMDVAYRRKAEEFLQYRQKVEEHKVKKESAQQALRQAKADLAKLQAEAAPVGSAMPFMPNEDPVALLATYNPLQGIATAMGSIAGIDQVPQTILQAMQAAMQDQFKVHLNIFAHRLVPHPPNPASTAPPAPAVPAAVGVCVGADGCSDLSDPSLLVADDSMLSVVGIKRTAEEVAREGIDCDEQTIMGFPGGFDDSQAEPDAQPKFDRVPNQANAQAVTQDAIASAVNAAHAATATASAADPSKGSL